MDARAIVMFPFPTGNTLFGKLGQKHKNCQFKLKFGTETNSNMQIFTFFVSDRNSPFLDIFSPKNQNCQFKLKLIS